MCRFFYAAADDAPTCSLKDFLSLPISVRVHCLGSWNPLSFVTSIFCRKWRVRVM
jgi:hypothetical protein